MPAEPFSLQALAGPVGILCRDASDAAARAFAASIELPVAWAVFGVERARSCAARVPVATFVIEFEAVQDGFADLLAEAARWTPRAALVVVGAPPREEVFRLPRANVDFYFESFPGAETPTLGGAGNEAEALLDVAARQSTGRLGVKDAQRRVRREMVRFALEASGGNRHEMARMLRVDRSYVLKMLREGTVLEPGTV